MAEIDPTLQLNEPRKSQAELRSAQAQKLASRAQLKQYQLELKRQGRWRATAPAWPAIWKAQAQHDAQLAQLKVNESQIVQPKWRRKTPVANLAFTRITAPIDGEVLGIVTREGQTIVSSQTAPTILVMADVDTMMVHTRISENDILQVKTGSRCGFTSPPIPVADMRGPWRDTAGAGGGAGNRPAGQGIRQQTAAVYYNGVFAVANDERRLRT